jgi:hypothetical protein
MKDDDPVPGMAKHLIALQDEGTYEAFLRRQSLAGDHRFLLSAIDRSDLHPSVRNVLRELLAGKGKLRRPSHRPTSEDVHKKGLQRALRVLDIEEEQRGERGRRNRDSAILQATTELHASYSTIEKAVLKYEPVLKHIKDPKLLEYLRNRI